MRTLVLYDSWFGNTKIAAETIAEGIREGEDEEVSVRHANTIPYAEIPEYDIVLIGTPNHIGGPTRATKRQIERLSQLDDRDLEGISIGFFDTCFRNQVGLATGKMVLRTHRIIPKAGLISPQLSVVVRGVRGPIDEGALVRCREFGERIADVFPIPKSRLLWDRA